MSPAISTVKPSGIAWAGPVPLHWKVLKLKHVLASVIAGGTPNSGVASNWASDGTSWVSIADMSGVDAVYETSKKVSAAGLLEKNLKVSEPGALLYSIYASLGHVAMLMIPAVTNQAILALTPSPQISSRYLFWFLNATRANVSVYASYGTQYNLNAEKVRNLPVLLPPPHEQAAIANYLDTKTAAIDALIAKKEELLGLLERYQQAVIVNAVTRGLDPSVRLSALGVEWLKFVPSHWLLVKGSHLLLKRKELNRGMKCVDRLALTMRGVIPRSLEDVDGLQSSDYEGYQLVEKDNLLFKLIDLENVKTSRVGLVPAQGIVSPAYIRLEVRSPNQLLPKYAFYWYYHMYLAQIFNEMGAGVRQTLSADELLRVPVALPPIPEQEAIVSHLDSKLSDIEALKIAAASVIEKLRQYRASVISAAVTGKIEVPTP